MPKKSDQAPDFDPGDIEGLSASGRGLAIIHGFMDSVDYRVQGRCKHLTMIKYIQPRSEPRVAESILKISGRTME